MDTRSEKKTFVVSDDNSQQSFYKSRDLTEVIYPTKQLKAGNSKEFKANDRSTVKALFEMAIAIPKSRKINLLREINENTAARQVDTQEVKIKKQRKRFDIKKVVQIKKRDSATKIVVSKKHSSFDEEKILYNARTRLQYHYEQIKRILHDQDNYLYDLYDLDTPKAEITLEKNPSTLNVPVLKSTRINVPDISKSIDPTQYGGKRVIVEDVASDLSHTNDFYDFTRAPQTERHILDIARHKASWADRRSFAARNSSNFGYGQRASIASGSIAVPAFEIANTKLTVDIGDRNKLSVRASMILNASDVSRRFSHVAGNRLTTVVEVKKERSFPVVSENMKGISGVSRKTIQCMNSKYEAKKDLQMQSKKNLDAYIWYLIDPIAKNKYNIFLQKSVIPPTQSESMDSYSNIKLRSGMQ